MHIRPPCLPDQSLEVIKTIEKYEKQKDFFQDHNQALKVLLKEREKAEQQLTQELQILKEKNSVLELNNCKLQGEMDNLFNKYNEINGEAEKYANYLRSAEDQLSISEKKRDELKVDAQETIKLWKNKVKKLEKSLEKHKNEAKSLGEQNQSLISNFNSLTAQIEARNQEASVLREINSSLESKVIDKYLPNLLLLCYFCMPSYNIIALLFYFVCEFPNYTFGLNVCQFVSF